MSVAVETTAYVDVSEIEKAKQGKVTGVIIPPPEIRAVVDKTAQFVARNGKSFEQRILSSGEGKTAKFNFMKAHDPYHAYYEMKIRDFEEGKVSTPAASNGAPPPPPQPVASQQVETTAAKATFTNPLARFAMNKPKEAPPPFEFSLGHPSGLRPIDIDVMKITAQYTALNGREFLSGLAQREARNPQFDFLKPTHMLFSYFTSLVDAYAKVLQPSSTLLKAVKERSNRISALEKSVHRWAWDRAESERKKQEAQQADAERSAIQSIDWYDFVVVETIEFREDELYEPAGMLSTGAGRLGARAVEEDMDMGDDMVQAPPPPPPMAPPRNNDEDMDMTDEAPATSTVDDDDGELNIVSDYKPRVGPAGLRSTKMVDPISGRAIPAEQMAEHMRIQLQDPKWRIEQQRFLEKQKESGMADSGSIAASLQQFAQQRGDIFGSAEEEEARLLMDESRRKKRIEETNRIIWDGNQSSVESAKRQRLENSAPATTASSGLADIYSRPAPPISAAPPLPSQFSAPPPPMQFAHVPPPPAPPTMPYAPLPPNGPPAHFMPPVPPIGAPPPMIHFAPPPMASLPIPPISTEPALIPEHEFASRFSGPITVQVSVPTSSPNPTWNLAGQTLDISISVNATVKDLKDIVGARVGDMPASKQQIKGKSGFLKDTQSLAALNIGPGELLEMSARSRGGKR